MIPINDNNVITPVNNPKLINNPKSIIDAVNYIPTTDPFSSPFTESNQSVIETSLVPRKYSKIDPTLKEFVVTLKSTDTKIHDAFVTEMTTDTTSVNVSNFLENIITESKIPSRSVEKSIKNINNRYTKYFLSDTEVEQLKNDPRILAVEIPFEQIYGSLETHDLPIKTDTGGFYKRQWPTQQEQGSYETHKSWAIIRSTSETDPYTGTISQIPSGIYFGSATDSNQQQLIIPSLIDGGAGATYTYMYDGTGVDVVICDTGVEFDHPEWEDDNGQSRLKQIDWYEAATGDPWAAAFELKNATIRVEEIGGGDVQYIISGESGNGQFDIQNVSYLLVPNKPGTINYDTMPMFTLISLGEKTDNGEYILYPAPWPGRTGYPIILPTLIYNQDGFVDFTSEEFKTWLATPRDYKFTKQVPYYQDPDGHGTHVASTVAGKIHGLAKNADIYVCDFLQAPESLELVLQWHKRKTNNRPTVLNCSWGFRARAYIGMPFGLEFHDTMIGVGNPNRIYSDVPGYINNVNQRCQYSLNKRSSPIKNVTIDGISYDDTTQFADPYVIQGVISTGNDNNIGYSNPRILNRLSAAKFGIGKNSSIIESLSSKDDSIYASSPVDDVNNIPENGLFDQIVGFDLYGIYAGIKSSDKTVVLWGDPIYVNLFQPPTDLGPCVKIFKPQGQHIVAMKTDGTVRAWGRNQYGQCNIPNNLKCIEVVPTTINSVVLFEDNTVKVYGNDLYSIENLTLNKKFKAISATNAIPYGRFVGILLDGTIVNSIDSGVWSTPTNLGKCKQISSNFRNTVALQEDGKVIVWGDGTDTNGDLLNLNQIPLNLGLCTHVHISRTNVIAIKENGNVVVWGSNLHGELDIPVSLNTCNYISSGYHTVIVKQTSGISVGWGFSNYRVYFNAISISGGQNSTQMDTIFQELTDAGIHVCLSAGNDSSIIAKEDETGWNDTVTVATMPQQIVTSVYAPFVDENETIINYKRKSSPTGIDCIYVGSYNSNTYFKNRSIESISHFSQHGPGVDIYAPGTNIVGACSTYSSFGSAGHTYSFSDKTDMVGRVHRQVKISGTSMSSPHVAGMAACMLQKFPQLSPKELKSYIVDKSKKGILKQQDTLDIVNGDSWWSLQLPDGTIKEIDDFIEYPYGQKFTLGVSDISQVGISYLATDIPADIRTKKGWYKYTDSDGNDQFILLPIISNITIDKINKKIKYRIIKGNDVNWSSLQDPNIDSLNPTGAHRIQTYFNEESVESGDIVNTRPPIYALSWLSTKGNVIDWSDGGTDSDPVTEFDYIKPMVLLKGSYGYTPSPAIGGDLAFWNSTGAGWQIPIIRNQLRVLENNNNLANTNIKSIRTIYYDQGWLFGHDPYIPNTNTTNTIDAYTPDIRSNQNFILYPDNEILRNILDWQYFLNALDDNMTNTDGLLIANTRLIGDNEAILGSGNFQLNEPYFNLLKNDVRFSQDKYGVDSLQKQLSDNGINDITWSDDLCPSGCGKPFQNGEQYLIWNKAVSTITTAVLNKVLWEPFVDRYKNIPGTTPTGSNYECSIMNFRDGYPDTNGHELYYDNLFGTSANVHLYGRMTNVDVWTISSIDPTHLVRKIGSEISFNCQNSPWNAFLVAIQAIRSCKRGLISKGITTGITPWIAPKDWQGDIAGIVGFVNNSYYDEALRHEALTGVEIFQIFNNSYASTDPTSIQNRKNQFTIINDILTDVNDRLGGYTPDTIITDRISYNCDHVISGAPTSDGKYLWRITPNFPDKNIYISNILMSKISGEIGIWHETVTDNKPIVTIQ
jgi:subtilisin family serine protease